MKNSIDTYWNGVLNKVDYYIQYSQERRMYQFSRKNLLCNWKDSLLLLCKVTCLNLAKGCSISHDNYYSILDKLLSLSKDVSQTLLPFTLVKVTMLD